MRERDDVIQIWNTRSDLADRATVIDKIKILLPQVTFLAEFYKGLFSFTIEDALSQNKKKLIN